MTFAFHRILVAILLLAGVQPAVAPSLAAGADPVLPYPPERGDDVSRARAPLVPQAPRR